MMLSFVWSVHRPGARLVGSGVPEYPCPSKVNSSGGGWTVHVHYNNIR